MSEIFWMFLYVNDYFGDMLCFSVEEYGVYLFWLMECWVWGYLFIDWLKFCWIVKIDLCKFKKVEWIFEQYFIRGECVDEE